MAQPWPHPKTGVFWFRRGVPADLRDAVGKREELRSLGTKDPAEARVRYAKISAEVEARWASLRAGVRLLTEAEAHALAREAHDTWLRWHADEPSEQNVWLPNLYDQVWTRSEYDREQGPRASVSADEFIVLNMRRFCLRQADNCLEHHGLIVDDDSRFKLARAIGAAFQRASKTLASLAEGELVPDQVPTLNATVRATPLYSNFTTSLTQSAVGSKSGFADVTMTGLLADWWREAKALDRKPSTYESYSNTVKGFVAFLKHDSASRITPQDVIAYKDHRLTTPSPRSGKVVSAKTVKDTDLVALKSLFGWAVANHKLPTNPAKDITLKLGKKRQTRLKGFTETEAIAILTACSTYVAGNRENTRTSAAKRWVPWLCAFTGARVGEIAQLRAEDVRIEGADWIIRITPDAGTVKTNQAREVVLHPQLVEMGFPTFAQRAARGHLFLTPGNDGDVLGPLTGLKNRLTEFVRSIVPDPRVQPNHGWRHRFSTMCRDAEINERVYNAIQGHAVKSVADQYGDVTLKAISAAIHKIPPIKTEKV
ncbi:Integrase [Aureimonas jatrophae]|uniref:Integrase n=2 Tax=Aureimonas jatrophae TaxID=1166073 RepID=A0A1H0NH96_9HYPH|nr:Integrase [Aureimonas jatrophae]